MAINIESGQTQKPHLVSMINGTLSWLEECMHAWGYTMLTTS
jgi:hypothetical protein